MTRSFIKQTVAQLIQQYGCKDPGQIACELGIHIKYADIGSLKGLYTVLLNHHFIVLHQDLSQGEQQLVLAHELGHHLLHQPLTDEDSIRQTVLYDLSTQVEYEANLFAAYLLLEENEAEQMLRQGFSLHEIAQAMQTDDNLVAVLLNRSLPYRSDFLKDAHRAQE